MRARTITALLITVLMLVTPITFAQRRARTRTQILEKNIRAELGFLASDAMQGRGSGTNYERVAAEYIGSQFRQFGLEPAGDPDSSGQKTFVQKVSLSSERFTESPSLTVTSGTEVRKWQYGKDLLVSFLRASKISGPLEILNSDGIPSKGAFALVRLADADDVQSRREITRKAMAAQAVGVLLLETEAIRRTREAGNPRLPSLPRRSDSEGNDSAFVIVSLSKEAFDSISAISVGSKVEFSGPTQVMDENNTWNAVGMLRGSSSSANKQVIFLSAHLDHLGVIENSQPAGDSIFNGADDDASGCVAVLELARALASGLRPKRTIYFVCFGSEERGGLGSQYFVAHSPVPLTQVVADITFEMLGRPDAKVPPNRLWLTGFERSTLGPVLARHGALLVADPHPEQNFFRRSDNYTLALKGVVAHTVSSFGLHTDYHRPSDEISKIDFPFMTKAIDSLLRPIRWLANSSFKPEWLPGKAPTRG